jgi:hypothetical protein
VFSRSVFALLALLAVAVAAPPQRDSGDVFVGASGCSSSSCHGGAGPKRSQFITWSRQDFHSRACVVLTNARSARMAESLGFSSAQASARCTVCHSPFQTLPAARLRPSAHPDEGVSCESCHGAAESWLRAHTRPDWNYATRVAAGMHDLRNLYGRANACVACHQNIEPELLRVGHPQLLFELDSQSVAEPKHWRDEDRWVGPRSWLTGQALALREISWALAQHPNDEAEKLRWSALGWLLAKVVGVQTTDPGAAAPALPTTTSDFAEMQRTADELARHAPQWSFGDLLIMKLLRVLAASDAEFIPHDDASAALLLARAERLVPALERLTAGLDSSAGIQSTFEKELELLREDIRQREQFDGRRFAAHLQALSQTLARRTH